MLPLSENARLAQYNIVHMLRTSISVSGEINAVKA